jgi:hypothetical protein
MPRRSPPIEALKTWLKVYTPTLYRALVVVKTRLLSEARIAASLLGAALRRRATGNEAWKSAGLKLVRNPGSPATGEYLHGPQHSALQRHLLHDHPRLTLVANLLHLEDLGPRLYDLIELETAGRAWTGYVVRHVDGRPPTPAEHDAGLRRLRALEARGVLEPLLPGGWSHEDLASVDCHGNALIDSATGSFAYVDFQSFRLTGYAAYLDALAVAATEATHFGDESLLRGGRYLLHRLRGTVQDPGMPA